MQIVREGHTIKVITEVVTEYNVDELEAEKANILEQLHKQAPTNKELIELGKTLHPYYVGNHHLNTRLNDLDILLNQKWQQSSIDEENLSLQQR